MRRDAIGMALWGSILLLQPIAKLAIPSRRSYETALGVPEQSRPQAGCCKESREPKAIRPHFRGPLSPPLSLARTWPLTDSKKLAPPPPSFLGRPEGSLWASHRAQGL
jgi:hypothetical protein